MFTWTADLVLRLIDAGERTTMSTYNSCYVFGIRKGLGLANAHAYAMNQTLIVLDQIERERLMVAAVDAAHDAIADAEWYGAVAA